jgi:adenosylmethionine---8-amino-7-oxononanoate aminotransferase
MTQSSPIWHPFTQHATAPEPLNIARANGAYLEIVDGRRLFDAISSWWVVTHGHCHPAIMTAIREQSAKLDQVIFAGCTHEPAERLAAALLHLVNRELHDHKSDGQLGLGHVFFSDSGSTAVEVALKMALGYWRNIGKPRSKIIAMQHGYHGDTIGTMSAGARGVFNAAYEPLLFDVERIPFPRLGYQQATLEALHKACESQTAAAFIVEPLILGAGGMLIYDAATLAEMKRICGASGTLFIADEVMTGWGRTGTLLACQQAAIVPDILCLAKGLTGGSLPLAVTLCKQPIFDAHYSKDRTKAFFHSSSYTANPIACAAAVANIELWNTEPVLDRIKALGTLQKRSLADLNADHRFENARQLGTIAAIDVKVPDAGYLAEAGPRIMAKAIERGVLIRPLGHTIYVMPPYCSTEYDMQMVYRVLGEAVSETS